MTFSAPVSSFLVLRGSTQRTPRSNQEDEQPNETHRSPSFTWPPRLLVRSLRHDFRARVLCLTTFARSLALLASGVSRSRARLEEKPVRLLDAFAFLVAVLFSSPRKLAMLSATHRHYNRTIPSPQRSSHSSLVNNSLTDVLVHLISLVSCDVCQRTSSSDVASQAPRHAPSAE